MSRAHANGSQLANSRKSGWRRNGTADRGERFVVSYVDGTGSRRAFGFTESHDEAEAWPWLGPLIVVVLASWLALYGLCALVERVLR